MKRAIILVSIAFLFFSFSTMYTMSSSQPPSGYNGEYGFYCNACHSSYGLNSGGGLVFATGLPAGGYTPGATYPFSITITHGTADRTRWGFEIAARNQIGQPVGSFTPTAFTAVLGSQAELGHLVATFTAPSNQYTYTGMSWTAPTTPTPDDATINFYMVGNAANGNGFNDGDYIYSNTTTITLPVRFGYFRATVQDKYKAVLEWQTTQETNTAFFVIERSTDGLTFTALDSVVAAGNSSVPHRYSFTDAWPRVYDRTVFYRLKQTDRDGHFLYSGIEKLVIQNQGTFIRNIVPNPVKQGQPFYTEVMSTSIQEVQVKLMNLQGIVLYNQKAKLLEGLNRLKINLPKKLTTGHYFVSVWNENFRQRVSLMAE